MIACSIKGRAKVVITPSERIILEYGDAKTTLVWENDYNLKGDRFDVARAVLRYFKLFDAKLHIKMSTEIPVQAGLAGSTALLSAVLAGVLKYLGKTVSKYYFAELNRAIELHHMNIHCGYQDAYMTTFGGLNYLDFRSKEHYRTLDNEIYAVVENLTDYVSDLPFVVAHTGIKHRSGEFHKPIRDRWLEGDKVVINGYKEIAQLAREGKKALIEGDFETLAYLMNENHRIQDSICPSGDMNNYLINVALKNGALGAKLAGAGGGGTIIALSLEPERTIRALKEAGAHDIIDLDPHNQGVVAQVLSVEDLRLAEDAATSSE